MDSRTDRKGYDACSSSFWSAPRQKFLSICSQLTFRADKSIESLSRDAEFDAGLRHWSQDETTASFSAHVHATLPDWVWRPSFARFIIRGD